MCDKHEVEEQAAEALENNAVENAQEVTTTENEAPAEGEAPTDAAPVEGDDPTE